MFELFDEFEHGIMSLNVATNGLGVIVYVLQALALYAIAQRRGIRKPWLAWIPVVNVWILGSISDQYRYVVKRQIKNKRKVLLSLSIVTSVYMVILVVFIIVGLFVGILSMEPILGEEMLPMELYSFADIFGGAVALLLLALPVAVLSVVHAVYYYMALYDVFVSCDPKNSRLYLVLSLVGNFVVEGVRCVFLMLCKDKDLGMPPRKVKPEVCVDAEPTKEPRDNVEE